MSVKIPLQRNGDSDFVLDVKRATTKQKQNKITGEGEHIRECKCNWEESHSSTLKFCLDGTKLDGGMKPVVDIPGCTC